MFQEVQTFVSNMMLTKADINKKKEMKYKYYWSFSSLESILI